MVNNNATPDQRDLIILSTLRAAQAPVSGQTLADSLGISRVALWKRIDQLKACSYRIQATKQGYFLLEDDAVTPWEFPAGTAIFYYPETTSTMDEAWRLAEAGAASGTLVITDRQLAGRGRLDHNWLSPDGGLYLTLILRAKLPASHAACLSLEGATTLIEWLREQHNCPLQFMWPNDLMAGQSKVGGILVELAGSPESPRFYTIGLGMNLHTPGLSDRASAGLAELTQHAPLRRDLALAFRDRVCAWAEQPVLNPDRWEQHCSLLSRQVLLTDWQGRETLGTARGFDERGALKISETGTGFDKNFLPGETVKVRLYNKNSGVSV